MSIELQAKTQPVAYRAQFQKLLNTYGSRSIALTMIVGDAILRHADNKLTSKEADSVLGLLMGVPDGDSYPALCGQIAAIRNAITEINTNRRQEPVNSFQGSVKKIWVTTVDKSQAITAVVGTAEIMSEVGLLTLDDLDSTISHIKSLDAPSLMMTKAGALKALKRLRLQYYNPFSDIDRRRSHLTAINQHLSDGEHRGQVNADHVVFALMRTVAAAGEGYTLGDVSIGLEAMGGGTTEVITAIKNCTALGSLKDLRMDGKRALERKGITPEQYYDWEHGIETNIQSIENSLKEFAEHLFQGYLKQHAR